MNATLSQRKRESGFQQVDERHIIAEEEGKWFSSSE